MREGSFYIRKSSQGDLVQTFELCTIYIECNLGLNLRFQNISINWIMEDVVFVFCLILVVALCSIVLRACFVFGMPKSRMGKDNFPWQYLSVLSTPPSFLYFYRYHQGSSEQCRLLLSPHPYSSIANPGTSGAPGDSVIVVDVPVRLDQPPAYHSSFQRSFGERLTDERHDHDQRRHHSHMKPLVGKEF